MEESEEYECREPVKETPAKQLEGIRTDTFYKLKSGLEHGNAWDIVSRLDALANTRPMHSLEEEGISYDIVQIGMSQDASRRVKKGRKMITTKTELW